MTLVVLGSGRSTGPFGPGHSAARRLSERHVCRAQLPTRTCSQVENFDRPSNRVMFRAACSSASWHARTKGDPR
jgi:hypothetical protein